MQKCASNAPLVTAASQISQGTINALLQAILKAFHKLASTDSRKDNDPVEIAFKLINSLKYLPISATFSDSFDAELGKLDIFSPLLQAAVTAANNGNIIWDLIAVLYAYISIHKQFHPLILQNLDLWKDFMADHNGETTSNANEERDSMKFGVLSLLSIVQNFEEVTSDLFNFLRLGLRYTLLKIWVPQWQKYDSSATNLISGDEKISKWITKDYQVDFFIITSLASKSTLEVLPSHYFAYKISKRISHFPNLIDSKLYRFAISTIMENGISENGSRNGIHGFNLNDLSFCFQILMEVVDHPELNYLQENRLILLLEIALNHLILVPTHCLHSSFGELGSTQSLSSTLNIIQFLLSKFLINMGNVSQLINKSNKICITSNNNKNNSSNNNSSTSNNNNNNNNSNSNNNNNNNNNNGINNNNSGNNNNNISGNTNRKKDWTQLYHTNYQIPYWFEDSILPPIPPISKSLFTFDKNLSCESDSIMIIKDLLRCLNLTILLTSKLLKDYDDLNINVLTQSSDCKYGEKNHVMIEQYMQLYLVPLFTSLLLAQQLKDQDQDQDQEKEKDKEEKEQLKTEERANIHLINSSSSRKLFSQLIFFNSLKLCEHLVIKEKNLALYHLIRFTTKISLDDLTLQKISINLLNHLFFHQISDGSDNDSLIQKLCLKNQLSFHALKDYITLWNDGSAVYSAFYNELFFEEQPKIESIKLTMSDLLKLFPDDDQPVLSTPLSTITSVTTNDNSIPLQLVSQKNAESFTPLSKYDAYSSTSFIPSTSNNASSNANKQQPQNSTPCSSNRYLFNKSSLLPQESNDGNKSGSIQGSGSMNDSYSLDNSFNTTNTNMTRQPTTLTRATDAMTTAPTTPTSYKNSSGSNNNNLWIESPMTNFKGSITNKNTSKNKIVNTGKNYILGGHNKVKNNSRAQSIHIDDFENNNN
ncbi:hypothetical protein SMKI_07G2130 [Saccharomyces mikatae IFO 1815]|uniref:Uncharacterized protein n=1 Tax=Saccharomyces mikatae IFO 1815 TaxID=226126 RepID=A0AA35IYF9_SACMI|nr:uncharacterized protein SMKI_07G2130 [Saccharomyces mikatae IFO 1815]CAI4039234.1 hypothetical protein SMKI_07G2130 [Saccharomyces mikatae IFO 1815]